MLRVINSFWRIELVLKYFVNSSKNIILLILIKDFSIKSWVNLGSLKAVKLPAGPAPVW